MPRSSSFFHRSRAPRHFHSFPTRRSSDLARLIAGSALIAVVPMAIAMFLFAHQMDARVRDEAADRLDAALGGMQARSEEHTSELQSLRHLVCRLLLEKKKNKQNNTAKTRR